MEWNALTIIEWVAVISGIVHVYLLTREKVIAWPFGILSVGLYIYIFGVSRLYSDMILHFVYVILNLYGWWNWTINAERQDQLPVTRLNRPEILGYSLLILLGFVVWGYLMANNTDADLPYGDAFTTVASLTAQFLLARKKLDNWVIWIIVDVVAIYIYLRKGLYPTTFLYGVYLLLSTKGLLDWRRSWLAERTTEG